MLDFVVMSTLAVLAIHSTNRYVRHRKADWMTDNARRVLFALLLIQWGLFLASLR